MKKTHVIILVNTEKAVDKLTSIHDKKKIRKKRNRAEL